MLYAPIHSNVNLLATLSLLLLLSKALPFPTFPNPPTKKSIESDVTSFYIAATAKYMPIDGDEASSVVDINLKSLDEIIKEAKAEDPNLHLMVFPEWGLFSSKSMTSRRNVLPYCDGDLSSSFSSSSSSSILESLKSMAKSNDVALVANLCDKIVLPDNSPLDSFNDGLLLYNTAVAIDHDGEHVATYHKSHPWYTSTFNTPPTPEVKTFTLKKLGEDSPLFGLIICYDLSFPQPKQSLVDLGVTDFPYSVALPVDLVADLWWHHFTSSYNVNMLASNLGGASKIYSKGKALGTNDEMRRYILAEVESTKKSTSLSNSDKARAMQVVPGDNFLGEDFAHMSELLNGWLVDGIAQTTPCNEWNTEDIQELQRTLYAARNAGFNGIYQSVDDNRRILKSLDDIESDWSDMRDYLSEVPAEHDAHQINRDGHCHEAVMWFTHHLTENVKALLANKGLVIPLLSLEEHHEPTSDAHDVHKKAYTSYKEQTVCSSCHAE